MKLKIFVIFFLFVFCGDASAKQENYRICLTGRLEQSLPIYKSYMVNSTNLAVETNKFKPSVEVKTYFFDSKPLSAIIAYQQMINDNCNAIIGFEYLSDILLISKQAGGKIPIFTTYASSLESDTIPNNIFMFMPTYNELARKMMRFLVLKHKAPKSVLLITEVDRPDLARYKIAYAKLLSEMKIPYNTFDYLENDGNMERNLKLKTTSKTYDFVFVLTGAVGAIKAISLLNNHKTTFIGTENFGSSTNQSVYVRLNDKNLHAYTIRNLDFLAKNKFLATFETKYISRFHEKPSPLCVYTFDATNFILHSLKQFGKINTSNLTSINLAGLSGAEFRNGIFHRSRLSTILAISKLGFSICPQN